MSDEDLKALFKSVSYGEPSEIEMSRWKTLYRRHVLARSRGEWMRLAVACAVGIAIGASVMKSLNDNGSEKNGDRDATIERVHVNLE